LRQLPQVDPDVRDITPLVETDPSEVLENSDEIQGGAGEWEGDYVEQNPQAKMPLPSRRSYSETSPPSSQESGVAPCKKVRWDPPQSWDDWGEQVQNNVNEVDNEVESLAQKVQGLEQTLVSQLEGARHEIGQMESRVYAGWDGLIHSIDNRFQQQEGQTHQLLQSELQGQSETLRSTHETLAQEVERNKQELKLHCQQQKIDVLSELARLKREVVAEMQENLHNMARQAQYSQELTPILVEQTVERILQQRLPTLIPIQFQGDLQKIEVLTSKVEVLEGIARRMTALENLLPRVVALESGGQRVGAIGVPAQAVEALEIKVGGLQTELAKTPPILASHQNHVLALRKGVEILGRRTDQQGELVQRGQTEVENFREWKRGAEQKIGDLDLGTRTVASQLGALEKKLATTLAHEKLERRQTLEVLDDSLQQVARAL